MLCSLALLAAGSAAAQDEAASSRLDDTRAVREAMANNPTLRAALLDLRRANESLRFEEGRYPYTLQLDAGLTRSASPRVSGSDVVVSTGDSIDVGAQISRTFPTGTRAAVRVDGSRDMSRKPDKSGPRYSTTARASVTQPLMRGFGTELGEMQLRIARMNRTASELSRDRVASETARDVLVAYWELWYAEAAVDIETNALGLAKRQRDEAQQRVDAGALAPVEVLTFDTRVASLEESVVSAETDQRRRGFTLAQRIGSTEGYSTNYLAEIDQEPVVSAMPLRTTAIEQALANSPEIRELNVQLRLAQEQVKTSGDSYRPRLDLEAYVQLSGLGNEEVPPALEQVVTAKATSAHVGIVYELPLDSSRKTAERTRDLLAVRVAEQRLVAARQRIQTEVETMLEQERAARVRLQMAETTAGIAEKQVAAVTERYQLGAAISVEVQQAEDELRRARLRAVRARVDLVEAEVQRSHATGALLTRLADQVPAAPPDTD